MRGGVLQLDGAARAKDLGRDLEKGPEGLCEMQGVGGDPAGERLRGVRT